jgi:signal peptidase I
MLKTIINALILAGTIAALPVLLVCLYDKFIAEPKRPRDEDGDPLPAKQWWVDWAWNLLPFVLLAAGASIGLGKVLGWAQMLVVPLSWLAAPLAALFAYDRWVLRPQRPRRRNGEPKDGPWYFTLANWVLLFAILAAIVRIGVPVVFEWVKTVSLPLSYAALPIGLWCLVDSWFLSPRRQVAAGNIKAPDPAATRAAYFVLPVLIVAVIVRMISAEALDFSLVLIVLSLATGAVVVIDRQFFRKERVALLAPLTPQPPPPPPDPKNKQPPQPVEPFAYDPGTVDYARSFFPVAVVVLLVRSFIFEPFRIPSDSMMPTLLDGDFIAVNKFAYGLRLPVVNKKFVATGEPQRGDVVVFRYPPEPNINYIKRLVGLPGDRVEVHNDRLIVNGEQIPLEEKERYTDGCYIGMRVAEEKLGEHTHRVMSCRSPRQLIAARGLSFAGEQAELAAACDRKRVVKEYGAFICDESNSDGAPDSGDFPVRVIPEGKYLMIGDNRDNSLDGRVWGFVPDENIVGKATRIWFNLDPQRSTPINWDRIGNSIE